MKLFLDDFRQPSDAGKYMHERIGGLNPIYFDGEWYIVRDFKQFCKAISKYYDEITHISFDHDLADEHYHESMEDKTAYEKHLSSCKEKTGKDCAEWMKSFYKEKNKELPV